MQGSNEGSDAAGDGHVSPARAWFTVFVIVAMVVLAYIDRAVLSLFGPLVQRDLLLSDNQMGLLYGLGFIALLAAVTLIVGYAIDRCSRVAIMMTGLLLWSVMTALCAFAGSYPLLLLTRGGVGAGEATVGPAGYAIIGDLFPPERRGRAVGLVAAAVSVGSGIALMAGGGLLDAIGPDDLHVPLAGTMHNWQFGFLLLGLTGLPVALLLATVRDPRKAGRSTDGADDFPLLAYLARHRRIFAAIIGCTVLNVALGTGAMAWGPTMLVRSHGMAAADAGYLLGLMAVIGGVIGAPVSAELSDRWIRKGAPGGRLRGYALMFPLMLGGVLLAGAASSPVFVAAGYLAVNFALAAVSALSYAAIQDVTPSPLRGQALAMLQFAALLVGYGVGPSLVAFVTEIVLADHNRIGAALIMLGVPMALLGIILGCQGARKVVPLRKGEFA